MKSFKLALTKQLKDDRLKTNENKQTKFTLTAHPRYRVNDVNFISATVNVCSLLVKQILSVGINRLPIVCGVIPEVSVAWGNSR